MPLLQPSNNFSASAIRRIFFFRGFPTTEKNIRKAVFVGGGEGKYVRGGERVSVGDEIQEHECLNTNSDDLSTFLQFIE